LYRSFPPVGPDGLDGVDGGEHHLRIVHVRSAHQDRERDAVGVDHKMALRALFAAIRWVLARFFEDLLARATEVGRAVITLNRVDFKQLHRQHPGHAGIIICTEDPDRVGQAGQVATALEQAGN
jgi:hypothetical protein